MQYITRLFTGNLNCGNHNVVRGIFINKTPQCFTEAMFRRKNNKPKEKAVALDDSTGKSKKKRERAAKNDTGLDEMETQLVEENDE